jgi:hypothetical protein
MNFLKLPSKLETRGLLGLQEELIIGIADILKNFNGIFLTV